MSAATTAAIASAAAYFDAKYHISKDVGNMRERSRMAATAQKLARQKKQSVYYLFEEQVLLRKDTPCLWYRPDPDVAPISYSWTQTYDSVNRHAQFLLDNGVSPGDFVASYLMNSPEFMHNLLGTWAIGAAPALINYNLTGDGLIHCLKVATSKILIVDEDEACQQRIQLVRPKLDELGIRVIVLDAETRRAINAKEATRPENTFRDNVTAGSPFFLFYTSGTTG